MKIEQRLWREDSGWSLSSQAELKDMAQLVLLFGPPQLIRQPLVFEEIRKLYPQAYLFGCSTSGDICGTQIFDNYIAATAVYFEHTRIRGAQIQGVEAGNSFFAGRELARALPHEDLSHVLVLTDGLNVNGSELIRGLLSEFPGHAAVTGGLAGDGNGFQKTFVVSNGFAQDQTIAVLGLYGKRLKVAYSTKGGWDSFGPERLVTKSSGNILYEMDGRSALELYRLYLGDHAQGLPSTGMMFPLNLRSHEGDTPVIRSVLGLNNDNGLVFGGDIPQGTYVRLMKANIDRLVQGAVSAAEYCKEQVGRVDLALLISCAARRLVLRQRTEEEVEAVQDIFGDSSILAGFYSFGEICPHGMGKPTEFHNQSMTITTFTED